MIFGVFQGSAAVLPQSYNVSRVIHSLLVHMLLFRCRQPHSYTRDMAHSSRALSAASSTWGLHINVGFKNSVEWEAAMKARLRQAFRHLLRSILLLHTFIMTRVPSGRAKAATTALHGSSVDKNFTLHWPQEQSQGCENAGK
jgi:hypothetical protein